MRENMADDFKLQLNTKLPSGALINIRAQDMEEMDGYLSALLVEESDFIQKLVDVDSALVAASNISRGGLTGAAPQGSPAPQAAPVGDSGLAPGKVQDKWSNTYEAGLPGAPLTPRGPAVKRSAISQKTNRLYFQWADPCEHPNWSGDRKPADKFERQFVN